MKDELPNSVGSILLKLHFRELSVNKIHEIPRDTFIHNENLTYLHLDWNNLTSIDKFTFKGLNNLKYLYMIHNLLTKIEEGIIEIEK